MRRLYSICPCIALLAATASQAAPPDRGSVQFTPEISYLFVDAKGNRELRFSNREGTAEVVVHKSTTGIYSHDLSSENAKLIAYTGPAGVDVRQWQAQPLQIGAARRIFSGETHYVDFAPDDSKLLFSTGTQLYVHDLAANTNTLIYQAPVIAYPRWSPDGSGDIFFFSQDPSTTISTWDLSKYDAETGTATVLRAAKNGFVGQFGLDVTRPSPAGPIYDAPRLLLADQIAIGEQRLRLFNLDGTPAEPVNVAGTQFHIDCANNRAVYWMETGRNDSVGITFLQGTPTVWKKDSRIRPAQIDWMRRAPCQ